MGGPSLMQGAVGLCGPAGKLESAELEAGLNRGAL